MFIDRAALLLRLLEDQVREQRGRNFSFCLNVNEALSLSLSLSSFPMIHTELSALLWLQVHFFHPFSLENFDLQVNGKKTDKAHELNPRLQKKSRKMHFFACQTVKQQRRGCSRRQKTAYGDAVNKVAPDPVRSPWTPKRENDSRRCIKNGVTSASLVASCLCCWQLSLSQPMPPLFCSAPPSLSLSLSLSLSDQGWCNVHKMLRSLGK